MGGERYYASIDVEASPAGPADPTPQPASQFRRSISIFSRRGTETPEPTPPFIAQAAMPRQMTDRQKSWIGRRKSVCSQSPKSPKTPKTPKTPKATILNAVPPARTIQMTPLEEEMATSPNEEILSAINERELTLSALNGGSSPLSPTQQDMLRSKSTTSLATHRTQSQKRKDSQSRIGIWINGVVHWDDSVIYDTHRQEERIEETGLTPVRPVSAGTQLGQQLAVRKPYLSVVIPAGQPLINDQTLSTIIHPKPRRPVISVAPASIVTKFPHQPPAIVLEESKDVSPLESDPERAVTPPDRPQAPGHSGSHRSQASRSSTSGSSVNTDTSGSSRRSSATSVEALGVSTAPNKDKSLPPLPISMPEREAPTPPSRNDRGSKTVRLPATVDMMPQESQIRHSRSMSELDRCDRDFIRSSPYTFLSTPEPTSPTLSQAEKDLEDSLESIQPSERHEPEAEPEVNVPSRSGSVLKRSDSVREVMQPPARAPTIPKRSRKRDWRMTRGTKSLGGIPAPQVPTRRRSESQMKPSDPPKKGHALRKSASISHSSHSSADLTSITERPSSSEQEKVDATPVVPSIVVNEEAESATQGPSPIMEADESIMTFVPSDSAENVLLHILANLKSTRDLFNTAVINKGMYRVFKENEMDLIRTVAYNESPAAWELREWTPPDRNEVNSGKASSQLEHTPMSYMRCFRRDQAVLERLKGMIIHKCQTFIRRETTFALSTPSHPNAARFNDAFWRIWCFCTIFGSNKGREDDITGQLDWLKGGLLANNQGCVATVNTNLDFDMSSVLLNAPDYFAKANEGGLYATQLFDMTEIWTCLAVLLQGYQGRVEQARKHGVFDGTGVVEGDIEAEEQTLEEWTAYLMTLGPSVVLEMAEFACDTSDAGFALAEAYGWTKWTQPVYNGSRTSFLKEPVAKSYEEQVLLAKLRLQDPLEQEKKEKSRQRVATLAAEIRLRRQSSEYKRLPLIDMNTERPMSMVSRTGSTRSRRSNMSRSTTMSRRTSSSTHHQLPVRHGSTLSPTSPSSLWASPRAISPIIEERVENFNRLNMRNLGGIAEDTSDMAVATIVAMGFTAPDATKALRMTDMGDGIRLDRAIELLLRQSDGIFP